MNSLSVIQSLHEKDDRQVSQPTGETVVLIHGTFASSDKDCGTDWWQVGSSAYQRLQQQLPENVSMAGEGEVFRWSGENTERERSKAAAKLLDFLEPLEAAGKRYHLVGHSHGGSVVWSALKLASIRKKPLQHLGSWSTVGTPFLRHRTRSPWNAISLMYMIMAALLLVPFVRVFWFLISIPTRIASGELNNGILLKSDAEVGLVSTLLRAPVVKLMEIMGVTFTVTPEGIRMGSYDPESGQAFSEFLFMTIEGWIILAGVLLFAYITLLLGTWCVRPVLASLRIRSENTSERRALNQYGPYWLGIWTRDDEAINGLRATLDLSISFVGKLVPQERVYFSDSIGLLSRPWFWVISPIFNNVFRPSLDAVVRGMVVKTAQGNNRPAAEVVDVAPCPLLPPDGPEVPPLPESLSERILDEANRHAEELGPKLRKLLAEPSFVSSLDHFGKELSGRELVHTAYFHHDDVIQLLAMNIAWSLDPRAFANDSEIEITRWFVEYKRHLENHFMNDRIDQREHKQFDSPRRQAA